MPKQYQEWLANEYQPIAGGALESNILGLWFAKQSAKGAFVANEKNSWTKRGRWVGGDLQVTRTDGEEAWSDQTLFSDHVDFVNTIIGNGAPVVQGTSSMIAYLTWLSFGQYSSFTVGASQEIELKGTVAVTGEGVITLTIGANKYTTAKIKASATGTEIAAAMEAAFPVQWKGSIKAENGAALLSASNTTALKFKFQGELANQPIPSEAILKTAEFTAGAPEFKNVAAKEGKLNKHIFTPNNSGGFYYGIAKEVGKSVIYRAQFNDCKTQSLRIEGSSASKVVKVTPTIISLNPGEVMKEEPAKKDEGLVPFIYTEAAGQIEIDGVAFHGIASFAVLFTWGLNEYYGDQAHPYDLINNVATATIEGLTLIIDQIGLERYNSQIYGEPKPASGTKPLENLPLLGSFKVKFERGSQVTSGISETLIIEMFGVKWSPTLAIPANPAGGAVELSFTGAMRKTPGGKYIKETKTEAEAATHGPFRVTMENWYDNAEFTA